jgi:hypothetical protein
MTVEEWPAAAERLRARLAAGGQSDQDMSTA